MYDQSVRRLGRQIQGLQGVYDVCKPSVSVHADALLVLLAVVSAALQNTQSQSVLSCSLWRASPAGLGEGHSPSSVRAGHHDGRPLPQAPDLPLSQHAAQQPRPHGPAAQHAQPQHGRTHGPYGADISHGPPRSVTRPPIIWSMTCIVSWWQGFMGRVGIVSVAAIYPS